MSRFASIARSVSMATAFAATATLSFGAAADSVAGLPLTERPATGTAGRTLAIVISGDGGWAGLVRHVSNALVEHGVPVVGLNSLRYFWRRRTPEQAAAALDAIARTYLQRWQRQTLLLVGYSMGADVLPFMYRGLPEEQQARVGSVVVIGPSTQVDFKFHLSNWFGGGNPDTALSVSAELAKLPASKLVCIWGEDEKDTPCRDLEAPIRSVELRGAHHFDGDFAAVVRVVLAAMNPSPELSLHVDEAPGENAPALSALAAEGGSR